MRIFLAEDEEKMRAELRNLLEKNSFDCTEARGFEDLPAQILQSDADFVLLDLNLPHLDGLAVLREVRAQSEVPVLILTSRDSEIDELMGMHLGADDFMTKPFNAQILIARIASIMRRTSRREDTGATLTGAGLTLDLLRGTVSGPEGTAELTKNEQTILGILLRRRGEIVTREDLIDALWQSDTFVDDNTLTVNVARLRQQLKAIGAPGVIRTRRGQGYQL